MARSSSDDTLCTSGFVYDVMFLYDGLNRPESKVFRRVRRVAVPGRSLPSPTASCSKVIVIESYRSDEKTHTSDRLLYLATKMVSNE